MGGRCKLEVKTWNREGQFGTIHLVQGTLRRVESATRLAVMGPSVLVIQRKEKWSSNAFTVYLRVKMEDLRWLSDVLSSERRCNRYPGQGTR